MRPTLRAGLAVALGFASAAAFGAEPASGTLTETSGPLEYTAGPFIVPNPTPDLALAGLEPTCDPALQNCDIYSLTVTLPDGYAEAHPDDSILIEIAWAGLTTDPAYVPDFDVYLYDEAGKLLADPDNGNPERIRVPVSDGTHRYEVRVATYMPAGESITGSIRLDTVEPQSSSGGVLAGGSLGQGLAVLALTALLRRRRS